MRAILSKFCNPLRSRSLHDLSLFKICCNLMHVECILTSSTLLSSYHIHPNGVSMTLSRSRSLTSYYCCNGLTPIMSISSKYIKHKSIPIHLHSIILYHDEVRCIISARRNYWMPGNPVDALIRARLSGTRPPDMRYRSAHIRSPAACRGISSGRHHQHPDGYIQR